MLGKDPKGRAKPLAPEVSFREALCAWIKIALLSFGGPAGQIALMHRVLVEDKKRFQNYLEKNGIASDVVHVRNDQYSCMKEFRDDTPFSLGGLEHFESRLLNIPVGWWVTKEQRQHIVEVINDYK